MQWAVDRAVGGSGDAGDLAHRGAEDVLVDEGALRPGAARPLPVNTAVGADDEKSSVLGRCCRTAGGRKGVVQRVGQDEGPRDEGDAHHDGKGGEDQPELVSQQALDGSFHMSEARISAPSVRMRSITESAVGEVSSPDTLAVGQEHRTIGERGAAGDHQGHHHDGLGGDSRTDRCRNASISLDALESRVPGGLIAGGRGRTTNEHPGTRHTLLLATGRAR